MIPRVRYCILALFAAVCLATSQARSDYIQTNLVSDTSGMAPITDANLLDPWGVAFSMTSPLWVSDQTSAKATVYNFSGPSPTGPSLTVNVMNVVALRPARRTAQRGR